jgi:hypothetical protein
MAIDSRGRDKPEELDFDEILGDLEKRLERVKILYEQYFMGIEKMEPQTARKEVARKIIELTQINIRNTGVRYRFNSLTQKWGVYQNYWGRVLRQIEAGTYFRNLSKVGRQAIANGDDVPEEILRKMPARMRERILKDREAIRARQAREAAARGSEPVSDEASLSPAAATAATATPTPSAAPVSRPTVHRLDPDDADLSDAFVDDLFDSIVSGDSSAKKAAPTSKPAPAPTPRPAPPPRPATPPPTGIPSRAPTPVPGAPAALPPGMDESTARTLYKQYVQAKKVVGEDTSKLRYESLVATLNKQAPQIMKAHQAAAVDFSVVIKDDKVILKATPKK